MRTFIFLALLSVSIGASYGAIQPADEVAMEDCGHAAPQPSQTKQESPAHPLLVSALSS
jgi:hypothetical protein